VIKVCNELEDGPFKEPGTCCAVCKKKPDGTKTELPKPDPNQNQTIPVPVVKKEQCVTDSTCTCVEDCFNPHKCDTTAPCCENVPCPTTFERNVKGACVLKAVCIEEPTKYEQKCTHPLLKSTDILDDITTSSDYRSGELVLYSGDEPVVDGKGWIVNSDRDADRQLTIKFTKVTIVTGFSVKQQNINAFSVSFSADGKLFTPYIENGQPKSYQGASFPSGKYETAFFKADVTTLYLRFTITAVDTVADKLAFPKLNVEVLGCYHTPTVCKEMEGLDNSLIIEDSMIVGVPTVPTSSVTEVRPKASGWKVPAKSPVKPTITLTLTKTKKPVKVQKVVVKGNVGSISLKYTQQSDASPIQPGTDEAKADTSVQGSVVITFSPYIEATSVIVTVDKPADDNVDYSLQMSVVACFEQSDAAVTDAPSTTVAPTTIATTFGSVDGTTVEPLPSTTSAPGVSTTSAATTVGSEATTTPESATTGSVVPTTTTSTTDQSTSSPTTVDSATTVADTTIVATTVSVPKVPCLNEMKNSGVVPADKLQVTRVESTDGKTVLIITSKTPDNEVSTWVKLTLTPGETKEFTVTFLNKDNTPVKPTDTVPVLEPSKPVEYTPAEPVTANRIVVVLTPLSSTPSKSDLASVVACIEEKDLMTTVVPTTSSPTTIATTAVSTDSTTVIATAPTTAEPTTVASTTVSTPKVPCLETIKDGGVIPVEKLTVTRTDGTDSTTVILSSSAPTDKQPTFVSFTVTKSSNLQTVSYTPAGKDNKPTGETKVVPVLNPSQPKEVVLAEPVNADRLIVTFTPSSNTPTDASVVSVVGCMQGVEETTVVTTPESSPATTPGSVTSPATTSVAPTDIPTTVSPTTVAATTTISIPISDVPCLKDMKDNGVVPKSELNVVTKQDGDKTTITVTSKNPQDTPVFSAVTITPGNVKDVTTTLFDEKNNPVGKTETPVSDPTKSTVVKFTPPTPAKILEVILTSSTDKPTVADLESIVACMESKEDTTTALTTPATTVPSTSAPTGITFTTDVATTTVSSAETTTAASATTTITSPTVGDTTIPTTSAPSTVAPTTDSAATTTISAPISDVPCLKDMKDNGVVPKSELNVVTKQEGDKTTITVTSTKSDETPTFVGAVITPGDVKEVKTTLFDDKNTPVGKTETPVSDSKTPTVVKFTTPTPAKTLEIVLTSSTDKPTTAICNLLWHAWKARKTLQL